VEITSQSAVEGYAVVDLLEPDTVISDSLPPTIVCSQYITQTAYIIVFLQQQSVFNAKTVLIN